MPELGWMLFAYTAGTAIGWWFSYQAKVQDTIELTIDSLIENGYLKTRGVGSNKEILKHWEDVDDQSPG